MADFWETAPSEVIIPRLRDYGGNVWEAVAQLAEFFARKLEAYARSNASWTDQTGAARAGLRAFVERTAQYVAIYLTHSVEYGKWLELSFGGRYAIIFRTLEVHYAELMNALRRLVNAR
jgi:hypothetical protein